MISKIVNAKWPLRINAAKTRKQWKYHLNSGKITPVFDVAPFCPNGCDVKSREKKLEFFTHLEPERWTNLSIQTIIQIELCALFIRAALNRAVVLPRNRTGSFDRENDWKFFHECRSAARPLLRIFSWSKFVCSRILYSGPFSLCRWHRWRAWLLLLNLFHFFDSESKNTA